GKLGAAIKTLSAKAKAIWKRDAQDWFTSADRPAFARYCQAEADWMRFRAVCDKEGWWVEGSAGSLVQHPAARMYEMNLKLAHAIGVEFGLTPSSRSRIVIPKRPSTNPAAEFFGTK
ncbi:MAG: phage terminase small subunit P27 family, partial [Acidobacteria bacterium]|nr:phage terminase small subunit P27 family [Acidobacteriota bacterium]